MMKDEAWQVIFSEQAPTNREAWDALCLQVGNLQQGRAFDRVQAFFHQQPVYLEVFLDGQLAGGLKLYRYLPATLPRLTERFGKYLLQAGECLLLPGHPDAAGILGQLEQAFRILLVRERPVFFRNYGYYDRPDLLLAPACRSPLEVYTFGNAWIDLEQEEESLWNTLHPHHRRWIRKSGSLRFGREEDPGILLRLLAETYRTKGRSGPDPGFIRLFFDTYGGAGNAGIFTIRKEGECLGAALVTWYGPIATYAFGASRKGREGASHLLHWELVRWLRQKGLSRYYLGQVALSYDRENPGFSEGISPFKRRFGTLEVNNKRETYVFKPISMRLWKLAMTLTGRK